MKQRRTDRLFHVHVYVCVCSIKFAVAFLCRRPIIAKGTGKENSETTEIEIIIIRMYSFMCYCSKLEHTTHYKAKNRNIVKTNSCARTHARTHAHTHAHTHTPQTRTHAHTHTHARTHTINRIA